MKSAVTVAIRPATEADLPTCEEIWREALNDYLLPLGQLEIPADNATLRQLHSHVLSTDPDLFCVATRHNPDQPGGVVGFAAAARRGPVWFLSMLFVRPHAQGEGIGRSLLERILPADGAVLAVATDAAQPISNGLYSAYGMAARLPMLSLVGRPTHPEALPQLPHGIGAGRVTGSTHQERNGALGSEIDALDRDVLGFAHPEDHELFHRQGRICFTYRNRVGRLVGYGYASEAGRIGPVAGRHATLIAPIVTDLMVALPPRGASAIWVGGDVGHTIEALVRAGLRIEGFPVLLGWTRAFADFSRYTPASPGLL